MKTIPEIIVKSLNIKNKTYVDRNGLSRNIVPETAYLILNSDKTHERYVSDERNVISKQGKEFTDKNIKLSDKTIALNQADFNTKITEKIYNLENAIANVSIPNDEIPQSIIDEFEEVKKSIDDLQKSIDNTPVGSVSDAALFAIRQQRNLVQNEYVDIVNRYNALLNDFYLLDKNMLRNAYENPNYGYLQAYNNLLNFLDTAFSDADITQTEKDELNVLFSLYRNALGSLSIEMQKAAKKIEAERSKNVDAKIEGAINNVGLEISDVENKLSSLESNYLDFASDGVFSIAEAKALETYIQLLNNEKADVYARYEEIYFNPNLLGTPKTNLEGTWNNYDTSHQSLINSILTAIGDGLSDQSEIDAIQLGFTDYREKLSLLVRAFEVAIFAIYNKAVDDLRQQVDDEIADLNTALGNMQTAIDNLPVGAISDASLFAITQQKNLIYNEYTDLVARYNVIVADPFLLDSSSLITIYGDTNTGYVKSFNDLYNYFDTAFNDADITQAEKDQLQAFLNTYRTNLQSLSTALQNALKTIEENRVEDLRTDINQEFVEVRLEIGDVTTRIDTFEGAFNDFASDGVIDIAEAKAIEKYINSLNAEKDDVTAKYNIIYEDAMLDGIPKTDLGTAYSNYNSSHGSLLTAINTAILDGKATAQEKGDVDTAFADYRLKLYALSTAFENALNHIYNAKVNNVVDMVFDSSGYFDTGKIKPLSIETKHIAIGDRMQRFSLPNVNFYLQSNYTALYHTAGSIVHDTVDLTPKTWTIASATITGITTSYQYVYVKASRTGSTATILVTPSKISVESDANFFHFEAGYISALVNGLRVIKMTHGFAQINPAELSIGRISSPTGGSYIDLKEDGIDVVGRVQFLPNSSGYENLTDKPDLSSFESTRDYVNTTLQTDLTDLKNRADGVIESWFYSHTPTLSNLPAVDWITNAEKDSHIGDTFTNMQEFVDNATTPDAGKAWRFAKNETTGVYSWNLIANSDSTKALIEAGKAKDTADSKRRVFIAQPFPPYDVGDLWSQGSAGDLMHCTTARVSGVYVASDWQKASKYTDDSALTTFVDVTYTNDKNALQAQIDGKIESWFQNTDPSTSWTTAEKTAHTGDMWYNTTTKELKTYTGTSWTLIEDQKSIDAYNLASTAKDTADGKRRVFVSQPTTADAYDIGDLWVNATVGSYVNEILRVKTAKASGVAFSVAHWDKASKYTDDSTINTFVSTTYNTDKNNLQTQIDGKIETWFQETDPATAWSTTAIKNLHIGDMWYNTIEKSLKRYNGTAWILVEDKTALDAYANAAIAQDTADGKRRVFVAQPTTADAYDVGDLWTNATVGSFTNELLRAVTSKASGQAFNAAHWIKSSKYTDDSSFTTFVGTTYTNDKNNLQTQIDGKIESWFQAADPETSWSTPELKTAHTGDMWYNTTTKELKRYSGSAWVLIEDQKSIDAYALASTAKDTADGKRRVFVAQPVPPYDIGDLWVQGTSGDIMRCATMRLSGNFVAGDWVKASKYTDDSALTNFVNVTYNADKNSFQSQIDGKVETWFQTTDPSTAWTTTALKSNHVGDMWYNSTTKELKTYNSSYAWVLIEDQKSIDAYALAETAKDTADGKRRIFVAQPTTADAYDIGDLWVNATSGSYNNDVLRCKTAKASGVAFSLAHWQLASKYTDDTRAVQAENNAKAYTDALDQQLTGEIGDLNTQLGTLQTEVNGLPIGALTDTALFGIKQQKNIVQSEYNDVYNRYLVILNDSFLTDKTPLTNAYNDYNTAYTSLTGYFDTAFNDNSITQAEKDELNLRFTNYRNTLASFSNALQTATKTIEQAKIDNIQIGGRNLLKGTSSEWTTLVMPASQYFSQFGSDIKIEYDTEYTFAIEVEKVSADSVPINLHLGLGSTAGNYTWDFPTWRKNGIEMGKKIILTHKVLPTDGGSGTHTFFAFRLRNEQQATTIRYRFVKLEKGNKATDWTPAPEDVESLIHDQQIYVEYSSDGTNWHTTFATGDLYMRQKKGSGNWSSAIRIVGEQGETGADGRYTDFEFSKNNSLTIAPTTGWQDAPPTLSSGEYLWMRSRDVVPPNTPPAWNTPIRLSGEQGSSGTHARVVSLTTNVAGFSYNVSGTTPAPTSSTFTATALNTSGTVYYAFSVNGTVQKNTTSNTFDYTPPANFSNMPQTIRVDIREGADTGTILASDTISVVGIKEGKGVSSTVVTYQKHTNGTTAPTGTWTTTIPSLNAGEYLWTRTIITYSDASTSVSYSVARAGIDGGSGADGKGISSSAIHYQVSASGTTVPTGTWASSVPSVPNGQFLWTRTMITYTDTSTSVSYSTSRSGTDGSDGADGYTIVLTNEAHTFAGDVNNAVQSDTTSGVIAWKGATRISAIIGANASTTSLPTGTTGLSCTIQNNGTTTAQITVSAQTTLVATSGTFDVPIIVDGKSFTKKFAWSVSRKGNTGANGVSVTSVDVWYAVSSSNSTAPTTGWSTNVPTWVDGQYIWSKTITTYSTGNPTESAPAVITGGKGATGTGVESITEEYVMTSAKTPVPTTGWSTTVPTWEVGKYIWTRSKIVYANPASTVYTTPIVSSEWEAINQIQIGGRNLLRNSGVPVTSTDYPIKTYSLTEKMVAGETYTLTLWGSLGAGKSYFGAWLQGGSISLGSLTDKGNGVYQATFIGKDSGVTTGDILHIYPVPNTTIVASTIDKIKLEKGNKATDWSPAPEDLDQAISNAQTAADNANTALTEIASDSKLSPLEKQDTKKEWDIIVGEKPKLDASAAEFGVSSAAYGTAYSNLNTYITPLLSNLTTTSDIVGATFRSTFKAYYDAKIDLLNAIASKGKLNDKVVVIDSTTKKFLNVGGYNYQSTITGYLVITSPIAISRMVQLSLSGFQYVNSSNIGNGNFKLDISCYHYAGFNTLSFSQTGNVNIPKVQVAKTVSGGGQLVYIIGLANTVWSYPKINIDQVIVGYQNPPDSWKDGWSVEVKTDISMYFNVTDVPGSNVVNEINLINAEITDVENKITGLQDLTNITFKDGIIDTAEAKAIEKYINLVNAEKEDLDKEYTSLYEDALLTGTPKTNLYNAKTAYDTAHTNLLSSIGTAVSGGKATPAQKADVDTKFTDYRTALGTLATRLTEAYKAIDTARVDAVQIGGRNLILNSSVRKETNAYFVADYELSEDLIDGQEYVITFYGSIAEGKVFYVGQFPSTAQVAFPSKIKDGVYSAKFTFQKNPSYPNDVRNKIKVYNYPNGDNIGFIAKAKLERGNKATDWSPAPEDVVAEYTALINQEIADVENQISGLQDLTNVSFRDGIIDTAEAKAIEKYINLVNAEKEDLDKEYNSVYADALLTGTAKTNLYDAKVAYNTAHTNLLSSINTAVSGGKATPAQKADVDSKFTTYRTNLGTLSTRFAEAYTSIEAVRVNNIQIGGRNLFALKNIGNYAGGNVGTNLSSFTISGSRISINSNPADLLGNKVTVVPGSDILIHGKTDLSSQTVYYKFEGGSQLNFTVPTVNGRFQFSLTVPNDATYLNLGLGKYPYTAPYYLEDVKVEKGNKATDWTPAPEDTQAQIDSLVSSADVEYYSSTSASTPTGGTWQTTAPAWVSGKYIFSRTKITKKDGTFYYSPNVNGTNITGAKGDNGLAGVGISSTAITYQKHTNGTTAPTGTWTTSIPSLSAGEYLWTRTIITYTDASTSTSYSVGMSGATGSAGKGVSGSSVHYQVSTSGTTVPTGTWLTTVPSVPNGQFLWTRTTITYTDSSTTQSYSTSRMGADGSAGRGISAITEQYYLSTSNSTPTGGSWVNSPPAWIVGRFMFTRSKIDWTNPTETTYSTAVLNEYLNDVQVRIKAEEDKTIEFENKTSFIGTTLDPNSNAVATGTLMLGQGSTTNAGITGTGDVNNGIFLWGGSTFANKDNANVWMKRNGHFRFKTTSGLEFDSLSGSITARHTNGNVGIKIAIIDGFPVMEFYKSDGTPVYRLGENGIYYITNIPESFTEKKLVNLLSNAETTDLSTFHDNIRNFLRYNASSGYKLISNKNSYQYSAGQNVDTETNRTYEGYKNTQSKTDNIPNGWYAFAVENPPMMMNPDNSVIVQVIRTSGGKVIHSGTTNVATSGYTIPTY